MTTTPAPAPAPIPTPAGHHFGHTMPLAPATCNFVLDLETLGTRPNSAILQIGITCIETKQTLGIQIGEAHYLNQGHLLTYEDTYDWWLRQDAALRDSVFATGVEPDDAVQPLLEWVHSQATLTNVPIKDAIVWANDPEFDCVILNNLLAWDDVDWPFSFRNHRSFRTLHAQMQETVGYSVWSHDAEMRFKDAISGASMPEGAKPQEAWTPIKHTGHGDSALEAMAIVAMQNIVYKRGCQMNMLRSSYAGWKLELVGAE